jgi:nicotinamidase-related amidase
VRVVFVRHVTLPVQLMGVAQMRLWLSWQRASSPTQVVSPFPPEAPQSQIVREVAPGPGEAVLDKLTMSAFEGTPVTYILRDCGVTTVVLAGVALEIGIEPTARHAADLGFIPVVATDACGAGNRARSAPVRGRCPALRGSRAARDLGANGRPARIVNRKPP